VGQLFEIGRGNASIVFLVLDGVLVLLVVARLVAILRVETIDGSCSTTGRMLLPPSTRLTTDRKLTIYNTQTPRAATNCQIEVLTSRPPRPEAAATALLRLCLAPGAWRRVGVYPSRQLRNNNRKPPRSSPRKVDEELDREEAAVPTQTQIRGRGRR